MKMFEKGKFACPVHSNANGIDGNGQQFVWTCLKCMLDDRGICNGEQLVCMNNHRRNTFSVFLMNGTHYVKHISDGKDEILTLPEVLKMAELIE